MLDLGGGWRVSTSWTASDTLAVHMELVDKSAWLSLAVSNDGSMTSAGVGSPSAVARWLDSPLVECPLLDSYSLAELQSDTDADACARRVQDFDRSDGVTRVTFTLASGCANGTSVAFGLCAAGRTTLLAAHGVDDGWMQHERYTTLTLSEDGSLVVDESGTSTTVLIALHVAFMGLGWLVLAPWTIIAARRRKHALHKAPAPDKAAVGKSSNWLLLHKLASTLLLITVLAGVACAVVSVELTAGRTHFSSLHAGLALVTICITLLQPVLGYFRPSKLHPRRALWYRLHHLLGYGLLLFALTTASLGIERLVYNQLTTVASAAGVAVARDDAHVYFASPLDGYDVAYTPAGAPSDLTIHWRIERDASPPTLRMAVRAARSIGWIAIAFSPSGIMEGSDSAVGMLRDGTAKIYHLAFEDLVRPAIPRSLGNGMLTVADGVATLEFSRPLAASSSDWRFSLDDNGVQPMLWAIGDDSSTPPGYHSARGSFAIELSATAGSQVDVSSANMTLSSGASTCDESLALRVMQCYRSYDGSAASTAVSFDGTAERYEHFLDVSREFRVAWTIDRSAGVASIMLQARTVGWLGLGLMGPTSIGNGMIETDMWVGRVVNGVAEMRDGWSISIEPPLWDREQPNSTDHLYEVSGYEDAVLRLTTLQFKRRLVTNDPWDHDIVEAGSVGMPVVYSFSPLGRDTLSHYHGPSRGYARVPFLQRQPLVSTPVLIVLLSVVGLILLGAATSALFNCAKRYRQALHARVALHQAKLQRVESAVKSVKDLSFCVVFTQFDAFKRSGKLRPHETARDAHSLTILDTYDEALAFVDEHPTVFVSHQWLARAEPDPSNLHFGAIVHAVEKLCESESIEPSTIYLWLDYSSIPQRNPTLKGLSISSISIYARVCRYFIAVAPEAIHADHGTTCDAASYQRRGWCRLEQWARLAIGGLTNMMLYDGEALKRISDSAHWYLDSIKVFDGDFTVASDKEALVDTLLGLWHDCLLNADSSASSHKIFALIQEHKAQVFPPTYFADLLPLVEERALERMSKAEDGSGGGSSSSTLTVEEKEQLGLSEKSKSVRRMSTSGRGAVKATSVKVVVDAEGSPAVSGAVAQ